jgi:hypothetical protein
MIAAIYARLSPAPYFSLARARWIPAVLTWHAATGALWRVEGAQGFESYQEAAQVSRFLARAAAHPPKTGVAMKRACITVAVGWYLLIPSPERPLGEHPRAGWGKAVEAPLSQWQQVGAFDSASECQRTLDRLWKQAEKALEKPEPDRHLRNEQVVAYMQYGSGRCVASDDPRMKP